MKFSACIEWLFSEDAPSSFPDRIRLAKENGLDAVEFWKWSNKDIDGIEAALKQTGLPLAGFVAEPMIPLTDPANMETFLHGLEESAALAQRLGAGVLIAQAGNDLEGHDRASQRAALVDCLRGAGKVLEGKGVRLGVEPLNTKVDHQGYFLDSTVEALDIMDEVGSPSVGIVYDLYHSAVMGEKIEDVLAGRLQHVFHAHVADHPGRGAPGTGRLDLAERLQWLFKSGYGGVVGLEYKPGGMNAGTMQDILARLQQPSAS
ncbi:MAG TPA: TIM barrel protein [Devosia sp.]|jgi:hydroxypyruvate isomerase|nr:TIM barrel protein [Devosia sp.]